MYVPIGGGINVGVLRALGVCICVCVCTHVCVCMCVSM